MTEDEAKQEFQRRLREESTQPLGWWYLSFADDDAGGFLGAAIVQARGFFSAIHRTYNLNIHPGGEIRGHPLNEECMAMCPYSHRNRLLSPQEVGEIGGEGLAPWPD